MPEKKYREIETLTVSIEIDGTGRAFQKDPIYQCITVLESALEQFKKHTFYDGSAWESFGLFDSEGQKAGDFYLNMEAVEWPTVEEAVESFKEHIESEGLELGSGDVLHCLDAAKKVDVIAVNEAFNTYVDFKIRDGDFPSEGYSWDWE